MMGDLQEGAGPGLSQEEKNDLETLIKVSREGWSEDSAASASNEQLRARLAEQGEQLSLLARIVLELDERINLLYRIVQLCHHRSELLGAESSWAGRSFSERRFLP